MFYDCCNAPMCTFVTGELEMHIWRW